MEEPDEVDYDDSDSDFADLDVEDEEDVVAQPKKAIQSIDDGPTLLRGDREEGEASPAASPKVAVTGASSELEDGEFLMDSEPMQLEEAPSAHEAASKRQHDVDDCSSDEEGRHRRKRRHELSPETGSGRSDLHRSTNLKRGSDLVKRRGTGQRSRESERARRSQGRESALKPHGSAYASVLDHGLRNAFHDLQPHVRNGSFPAFAPPPVRMDLHPLLHPPPSNAPSLGAPMRPAYAPPLEIRGAAHLVHDLRAGQASSQVFHLAYPPQAKHDQHSARHAVINPSAPMQPMFPRPMHGIPFGNHPPFDVRVPFDNPLRPGGFHPGGPRPPLKMADALFLGPSLHRDRFLNNGRPFCQGSEQFNGRPTRKHDAIPPHEPRNNRGRSPTQGASFPGVSRPPSDILRPGSGRVESVRSQLEGQGSGLGDPSRPRSDLPRQQRGILPLPPPPPDRRLEHRMSAGRSPPELKRQGDVARAVDQRPSFSPERKSPVKEQITRGVRGGFERRDGGEAEGGSPRGKIEESPGQEKAPRKTSRSPPVSVDRLPEAKGSPPSGDKKTVLEDGSSVPVEVGKLPVEGGSPRGGLATRQQRSSSTGGERDVSPSGTGRSSSKGPPSGSHGSQKAREDSERKREEEARERELKEKVMRARALQILEAGKHKKRREREEDIQPGTSGRDVNRVGLHGLKRDGRDKNGQRAPRNWRRHSGFDEEEERSSSGERQDIPERGSEGMGAREQNGFAEAGSRKRRRRGGTNANTLPLGEKTWGKRDEDDGSLAQPNGRRVVVGLPPGERRPDLPRFSVRERDLDPDEHSARHSPGPPGFEGRAQRQGSRFGAEDVRANRADQRRRFGSPDRSTALRRRGSGVVVGVRARQPSRTLVVNNLPLHYKMGHMTDIFKQYGPIQLIRQTGKSSAEVTFKREEDAKAARANIHRVVKLEGQDLLVEF